MMGVIVYAQLFLLMHLGSGQEWVWKQGRATFYGQEHSTIHQGSCGYGQMCPQKGTGWDVAAMSEAHWAYENSCGRCYEVQCRTATFTDGFGEQIDRTNKDICIQQDSSVVVTVVDTCPCDKENNYYSNARWCCGDMEHLGLSVYAFEKLASIQNGVIGISYREVPCDYQPHKIAKQIKNPSQASRDFDENKCTEQNNKNDNFEQNFVQDDAKNREQKQLSNAQATLDEKWSLLLNTDFTLLSNRKNMQNFNQNNKNNRINNQNNDNAQNQYHVYDHQNQNNQHVQSARNFDATSNSNVQNDQNMYYVQNINNANYQQYDDTKNNQNQHQIPMEKGNVNAQYVQNDQNQTNTNVQNVQNALDQNAYQNFTRYQNGAQNSRYNDQNIIQPDTLQNINDYNQNTIKIDDFSQLSGQIDDNALKSQQIFMSNFDSIYAQNQTIYDSINQSKNWWVLSSKAHLQRKNGESMLANGTAICGEIKPGGFVEFVGMDGAFYAQSALTIWLKQDFNNYENQNSNSNSSIVPDLDLNIGSTHGMCAPFRLVDLKPEDFSNGYAKMNINLGIFDVPRTNTHAYVFKECNGNLASIINTLRFTNSKISSQTICIDQIELFSHT
eukprot:TRINITY_DN12147_c0_g1_i1.p1 TRINITY_DN12147_c0_g1~~TRINITY_DN12147_c0_g1_i1.p1  ORF type:complete len:612 (-),score=71.98 TRINITY_DN12147_c0_g1_i1:1325-3160(-)